MQQQKKFFSLMMFIRPHRAGFIASVILAILSVASGLLPYFAVAKIVNLLIAGESAFQIYLTWGIVALMAYLLKSILHGISTRCSHEATFHVLSEIRQSIADKLTRVSMGFLTDTPSGRLKTTMVERVEQMEVPLAHIIPEMTSNLLVPIAIVVYLFILDWRMALVSLITIPIGMLCYMAQMKEYPKKYGAVVQASKHMSATTVEYINGIFKKQVIDYNTEKQREKAPDYLHVENEFVCFHTGLYTRRYKAIYGCFDRNKRKDSLLNWYFRGFSDELAPCLKYVNPLPKKPHYDMAQYGVNYNPEWPIRVNTDHILGDAENFSRLPETVRGAKNLPLLLETAVELARRWAVVDPGIVVPQGYQGRVQYLLPICLTDMENPDLAMTLTVMDGYYLGNTCLTLEMAYLNARLLARPAAAWLTEQVM